MGAGPLTAVYYYRSLKTKRPGEDVSGGLVLKKLCAMETSTPQFQQWRQPSSASCLGGDTSPIGVEGIAVKHLQEVLTNLMRGESIRR